MPRPWFPIGEKGVGAHSPGEIKGRVKKSTSEKIGWKHDLFISSIFSRDYFSSIRLMCPLILLLISLRALKAQWKLMYKSWGRQQPRERIVHLGKYFPKMMFFLDMVEWRPSLSKTVIFFPLKGKSVIFEGRAQSQNHGIPLRFSFFGHNFGPKEDQSRVFSRKPKEFRETFFKFLWKTHFLVVFQGI